jgi:hypothetical protein
MFSDQKPVVCASFLVGGGERAFAGGSAMAKRTLRHTVRLKPDTIEGFAREQTRLPSVVRFQFQVLSWSDGDRRVAFALEQNQPVRALLWSM